MEALSWTHSLWLLLPLCLVVVEQFKAPLGLDR